MVYWTDYENREEWLKARVFSVGASESAVACGLSQIRAQSDLWQEKTGRKQPDDLSGNKLVAYGTEAEKHLRALFALKHEDMKVEYFPYKVYYRTETPYITCTLDGEITTADGKKGIYECKTKLITSKKDLEYWQDSIPQNYFIQTLQQLYCTDFDFVLLNAELRFPDGSAEIREYQIKKENHLNDIQWLVEQVKKFWGYVDRDECPPERFAL